REQEIRIFEGAPVPVLPIDAPYTIGAPAPVEGPDPARAALVGGRYRRVQVARLHRFSELRGQSERALTRRFPPVALAVRDQLIGYVLDRLPPSLRYSRTN